MKALSVSERARSSCFMEERHPVFWKFSNFDSVRVPDFARSAYLGLVPYLKGFLVEKHPYRKGPICPFMPRAILDDRIYFTYFDVSDIAECSDLIGSCISFYKHACKEGFGAVVIIFRDDIDVRDLLRVHVENKERCVREFLMLGVLYKENSATSIHSAEYFPLRTPTPVLVLRDIVASDLMFLDPEHYSLRKRCLFLDSFIQRFSVGSCSSFTAKQVEDAIKLRRKYRNKILRFRISITLFSAVLVGAILWL